MRHFSSPPGSLSIAGLLAAFLLLVASVPHAQAQSIKTARIHGYAQTAPQQGWLWMDGSLFWTEEDGAAWREITPQASDTGKIEAVTFIDSMHGFVLLRGAGSAAGAYLLAQTADAGRTWHYQPLALDGLGDFPSPVAAVHMGWRDTKLGWMVFRFASGSNFSLGALFITQDGGRSWGQREIPLGEPATFLNDITGWVAGGPAGDQLYRTLDGGLTWQPQKVGSGTAYYSLPRFDEAGHGMLPVVTLDQQPHLEIYGAEDVENWTRLTHIPLAADTPPQAELALTLLGDGRFVLHLPGSDRTAVFSGGQLTTLESPAGLSTEIVSLSMSDLRSGWAKWARGSCSTSGLGTECRRETGLLTTQDGGVSWDALPLPLGTGVLQEEMLVGKKAASPNSGEGITAADPDTQPYAGHGFDTCEIPTLSQLQTWWAHSPYNAVNLYIGGAARTCSNAALSASFLSQLHAQGWRFIPTWVGPQASCSYYWPRMDSNVVSAYSQGIAEADAAMSVALALGLTGPDKSGTVIYYDLEAYDITDPDCRAAANAFISGWTGRMQAYGNLGAAYGASWSSAVSDWASIANVPDALWVANWYGSAPGVSFDPSANVWNAFGLSNELWSDHQRLRQYAGGHDETWGGLTLNIDSNVLDGPVTVPNGTGSLLAPTRPSRLSPEEGSTWARGTDTWLFWKTTGDTCTVRVWGGSISFNRNSSCSQFHLGVRAGGAYSWKVTAVNGAATTVGPIWHFNIRPRGVTGLSGSAASSTRVDLSWNLSSDEPADIDGYVVFADGENVGRVGKGVSSFQVTDLSCLSTHAFSVKSVRQGVKSAPSSTILVDTPGCAPAMLAPGDLTTTRSLRPAFTWAAVADATGYRLQISSSPAFTSTRTDELLSGTSWTPTQDMPADSLFYWRVRARGGFGEGNWSTPFAFTTANPPGVPLLLAPSSNALTQDYTPLLDWSDVSLPQGTTLDHYQVRLSEESQFQAPRYLESTPLSEFTVPERLGADKTWYWQVRAYNTLGQYGSWSVKKSFRTAIEKPKLLSPAQGSTVTELRPLLDWRGVAGASSYSVQVSTSPDFSTLLASASPLGSAYTLKTDLPRGSAIYWRVRSNAANGPSAWSNGTFTVAP